MRKYFLLSFFCLLLFPVWQIIRLEGRNEPNTLVIGIMDDLVSLDPARAYELLSVGMLPLVYEGLTDFQEDIEKGQPGVAQSWSVSSDGRIWTFFLRKHVFFSTGREMTADDVIQSLLRAVALNGDPAWILGQFAFSVSSFRAIDRYTVQITLSQKYAPRILLSCLSNPVASILDMQEVMAHEVNGDMGSAWLEEHSAGTGRFMFAGQIRGQEYSLIENPYFRDKGVVSSLSRIRIKHIALSATRIAALERGDIDLAWDIGENEAQRLQFSSFRTAFNETFELSFLGVSFGETCDRGTVLHAINSAINKEALILTLPQGKGSLLSTFLPPGLMPAFTVPAIPYDKRFAYQLLLEEPCVTEPFYLIYDAPFYSKQAILIKSDLSKIGLQVFLHGYPASILYSPGFSWDMYRNKNVLIISVWGADYPDPQAVLAPFAPYDIGDIYAETSVTSLVRYTDLELAGVLRQVKYELDWKTREQLLQKVLTMYAARSPFIPLYTTTKIFAYREDVAPYIGNPSLGSPCFPILK